MVVITIGFKSNKYKVSSPAAERLWIRTLDLSFMTLFKKGLPKTNILAYWAHSFSLKLTNGPNKLEYFITLFWKGLPGANNLA
jgi:hypothetical protein